MKTKKIYFAFQIVVHAFNGNAEAIVQGVGVIKSDDGKPPLLSEETILACISLGQVLRKIVVTNGYTIANGKLVKVEVLPSKPA